MTTEFYAKILDASGNVIGDGPLTNLTELSDTRRMDMIGDASFAMPGSDLRAAKYLTAGCKFDLYDRVDGYLGRYLFKSKSIQDRNGEATMVVQCHDALRELSMVSVNFNRSYAATDVATVVAALVALVSGWSATVDAGIGNTSIIYNGESVLIAVDALRDRWNKHFRLSGTSVLEFGSFGAASGVTLTNLRGQVQPELDQAREVAIVESLELVEESDEIFNRVVPLGAGQGTAQLNIASATLGAYTVQVGTNADASSYYYIENAASVAAYGRRAKVLTFPQIAPIANSAAAITAAANALKLSAEAYIARHLAPKLVYSATLRALRTAVRVGDLVRLQYRGIVKNYAQSDVQNNYAYVDVNQEFYALDVTRSRLVTGERTQEIVLASIAERRTADSDVMLEVISDLKALKLHIPTNITHSIAGPYTLRIDATHSATFNMTLGNEVLNALYAKLRFKTTPLKSSVRTVNTTDNTTTTSGASTLVTTNDGGSATPTSSDGGSASPTSSDGGSATPTSSNGGAQTVTSGNPSAYHYHTLPLGDGTTGTPVYHNISAPYTSGGGSWSTNFTDSDHTHNVSTTNHNHSVTIGNHNHTVTIGNHNHTVTIGNHNHGMNHTHNMTVAGHNHSINYGIYEETGVYPASLSVSIDGVDRTAALGGPWDAGGAGISGTEVDITAYLSTPLQANHTVVFTCSSGQGEIEANVRMLLTIQAIAVAP